MRNDERRPEAGLCKLLAADGFYAARQALEALAQETANGTNPFNDIGDLGPVHLLGPAARGDLEAQRHLAIWGHLVACSGHDADPLSTLTEAIQYARLAAEHGEFHDEYRCIMMLALAADLGGNAAPSAYAPECVGRLSKMADEGNMAAGDLIALHAGAETPELLQIARAFSEQLSNPQPTEDEK